MAQRPTFRSRGSAGANLAPVPAEGGLAALSALRFDQQPLAETEDRPPAQTPNEVALPVSDLPRLLKPAQVRAVFAISERTLRRWLAQGYLVPIRVGRAVFFHPDDIQRMVRDRCFKALLAGCPRA